MTHNLPGRYVHKWLERRFDQIARYRSVQGIGQASLLGFLQIDARIKAEDATAFLFGALHRFVSSMQPFGTVGGILWKRCDPYRCANTYRSRLGNEWRADVVV